MLIRCTIQGRVIIYGVPSRQQYVWENNQNINVLDEDVPDLLSKRETTGGCCGATKQEKVLFEIVS